MSSCAIFSQRFRSLGSTSLTFRFSVGPFPFVCKGRNAYWGNLRLCSSSAALALACQTSRSSWGRFCQVSPMILDSVLWLVSTSDETCWFLMKDERKRMNAFGGRGIWFSGFFFACAARRVPALLSALAGKRRDSADESEDGLGGSLNVPGVTFGANAMLCAADISTEEVGVSWTSARRLYQSRRRRRRSWRMYLGWRCASEDERVLEAWWQGDRMWQVPRTAAADGEGSDSRAGEVMEEGCRKWSTCGRLHTSYTGRRTRVRKASNSEAVAFRHFETCPNRRTRVISPLSSRISW